MTEIKRGPTDYLAETILAYIRENAELRAANDRLLSQLPENMKDCTIRLGVLVEESSTSHTPDNLSNDTAYEVWQAMIDAALKEGETK